MKSANMVYAATAADALAAPQAEKEVLEADDAVESMDFDDVSSDIVIREDFSTTIAWVPAFEIGELGTLCQIEFRNLIITEVKVDEFGAFRYVERGELILPTTEIYQLGALSRVKLREPVFRAVQFDELGAFSHVERDELILPAPE